MKLKEVIAKLNLKVKTTNNKLLDTEVNKGYASDLLSDVLANGQEGDLWITLQTHQNIVAVASVKGLAGIIIINNREPEKETIKKADGENIPIMVSDLPAFEFIGQLYALGISGIKDAGKGV